MSDSRSARKLCLMPDRRSHSQLVDYDIMQLPPEGKPPFLMVACFFISEKKERCHSLTLSFEITIGFRYHFHLA